MKKLPERFEIEIIISQDGSFDGTVLGVEGPSCEEVQKLFDELGREVSHRRTPDYYKRASITKKITTKTG